MKRIGVRAFTVLVAFVVGVSSVRAAIGPIVQQAYLKPAAVGTTQEGDWFGNAVAVSGDTVVIGAPLEDSSTTGVNSTPNEDSDTAGAAYVFVRDASGWTQQAYLKPATNLPGDYFGYAVAISGDTLVVGSLTTVFVFVRHGTNWTQQARLTAVTVGTTAGDFFGSSVSIAGDTVIVGAPYEDSSTRGVNSTANENASASGAAYIFVRSGTDWTQQAYLKPAAVGTTQVSDFFGTSVSVSGDLVVVGAPFESSTTTGVNSTPNEGTFYAGAAYIFARNGTNWTQQAYLKPGAVGTTQAGDQFGRSVAASGETVVVGALYESSSTTGVNSTPNENAQEAGAVYVFTRIGTNWTQQAYLKPTLDGSPTPRRYWFGASVGVSGDTIVVGANGADRASGTAYVFLRSGTNWAQQTSLKPVTSYIDRDDDEFGWSIGVSGNTIVVAANREDSTSTGVNSTPNESNFNFNSGAAYIFAFVLVCPADVVVPNTPGQCYATNVAFAFPDAGAATVTCRLGSTIITSPWSFNMGTNRITCTVSNGVGVDECSFNVIVRDTEPPVFTSCPTNQVLVVSPMSNSVTAVFNPVAQDNCGTDGLVITCVPLSGSVFPLGTNHVVCTATDASGNFSKCTFEVVVIGARGLKESVLAELIALRAGITDKQDGKRLDQAIEDLTKSLDADLWLNETHLELKHGQRAFSEEKQTVKHLFDALKRDSTTLPTAVVQDAIDRIIRADRLLAATAIADAGGADTQQLSNAQRELARGDADAADGNPDKAIEHYSQAWHHATHFKITSFVRTAGGGAQIQFLGEPLQRYVIQYSTDLKKWTPLVTRAADADGMLHYDDVAASDSPIRFYRIATP